MDFFGVGDACKALEGVIDRLIKFFTERHIRKERDKQATLKTKREGIKVEKEEQSLLALKLRNADALLKLRKKHPGAQIPDNFLIDLFVRDQNILVPRIAEGKLIAVTSSE
jgi:hypothetical protein